MRRLLLDLSVVLDVLLDRKPHVTSAAALWAAVEAGRGEGVLSAHAFTTIHYLARRARGPRFARQTLEDLLRVFQVAPVDGAVVRSALALSWPDFEDAVCATAAATSRCEAIVSRDLSGFPDSPVPIIDPRTAVAWLTVQ